MFNDLFEIQAIYKFHQYCGSVGYFEDSFDSNDVLVVELHDNLSFVPEPAQLILILKPLLFQDLDGDLFDRASSVHVALVNVSEATGATNFLNLDVQ